jgi:phospholipase C
METRRDFLKKVALLSAVAGTLPPSIQKAFAINPAPGSTYLDAEHIVILMQENRSFDHCYGTLQGVRGFEDPRTIHLPNGNKAWLQTNAAGETYAPFRLNIKDTKSTWMGSLPHSWTNQVDARNGGKYDQWLQAKPSGHKEYAGMPLTMGHYTREDIPFYYALADAFTVCDQNFCSSLTGTTPNRLYLWTGTIREHAQAFARVRNEELDYDVPASWTTFPERLEDNGISWKIYQNEINVGVGFEGEQDDWLANFSDNPIEWFTQYHVKFHPAYIKHLPDAIEKMTHDIADAEKKLAGLTGAEAKKLSGQIAEGKQMLARYREDQKTLTPEAFAKIPEREKSLHRKAFTTNIGDPDYHTLEKVKYADGNEVREMQVPKGDVLHQFRTDVKNGTLPTVSWLVAPTNFSDHPGAPWYGSWYLSESIDILTKNPEVWKKTIFILCYDENDGYYDHVPPFVPPHPTKPNTGKMSPGIDAATEYVTMAQELKHQPANESRESSIGLGYRVPLVIASPWSRGGAVCSQVFDHTSILQFLEKFLSHKTGKKITETNITAWRRAVCGDLTSVFTPYNGENVTLPPFVDKESFLEGIHKAQFKGLPTGYQKLNAEEIEKINQNAASPYMPQQEKGMRISRALPYQLYAQGKISVDKKTFGITLESRKEKFGEATAGAPFHVYAHGKAYQVRDYAVAAGKSVADTWPLTDFDKGHYHFQVYGPNGFYRTFAGDAQDPALEITVEYSKNGKEFTGNVDVMLVNKNTKGAYTIEIKDLSYAYGSQAKTVPAGGKATVVVELDKTHGWYDFGVIVKESPTFERRFAGRVETGVEGFTDPSIGR